MSDAIRAKDLGADVLLIEKTELYGGSSAMSGGSLWIPCNHLMAIQHVLFLQMVWEDTLAVL